MRNEENKEKKLMRIIFYIFALAMLALVLLMCYGCCKKCIERFVNKNEYAIYYNRPTQERIQFKTYNKIIITIEKYSEMGMKVWRDAQAEGCKIQWVNKDNLDSHTFKTWRLVNCKIDYETLKRNYKEDYIKELDSGYIEFKKQLINK